VLWCVACVPALSGHGLMPFANTNQLECCAQRQCLLAPPLALSSRTCKPSVFPDLQAAVLVRRLRSGLEAALEQLVGGSTGKGNAAGAVSNELVATAAKVLEAEEAALQRDRA
jgi:hypothetical protein